MPSNVLPLKTSRVPPATHYATAGGVCFTSSGTLACVLSSSAISVE